MPASDPGPAGGAILTDIREESIYAALIVTYPIPSLQPGTVSLMPQGVQEQLTRQDLADLIAFLKTPSPGR